MRSLVLAVVIASTLPACTLYFHNEDEDDVACPVYNGTYPDQGAPNVPAIILRNPETGQCEGQTVGYPTCDPNCGPCPEVEANPPLPDWGSCYTQCESLDVDTCRATSGCQAAFTEDPRADQLPVFAGCWATAPSGPIEGGSCVGLDAYQCSRHDDCSPLHADYAGARPTPPTSPVYSTFEECLDEQPSGMTCDNVDCGEGTHCEVQCKDACPAGDCSPGETCGPFCVPDVPPPTQCDEATNEMQCEANGGCRPVYEGSDCTCYPGYCTCEVETYDHCEWLPD